MNTKNLLIATIAGGLISIVLVNTPFVNLINVMVCAGFWIGPIAAVWIYQRLDGTLTLRQAIGIGVLTGAWHALFGLILSPMGLAGAGGLLNMVQSFVPAEDLTDMEATLTGFGAVLFYLFAVVFDLTFGFLGGLLGGLIFRPRRVIA